VLSLGGLLLALHTAAGAFVLIFVTVNGAGRYFATSVVLQLCALIINSVSCVTYCKNWRLQVEVDRIHDDEHLLILVCQAVWLS
jgi:amino acid transporter